ncbi:MAG: type II toxin-antitoxin system RelE/ParE family toxin [Lacipirellulaceae bacterium]
MTGRRRKLRVSQAAQGDLAEIVAYLAPRSSPSAKRVVEVIRQSFQRILREPRVGSALDGLAPGLRALSLPPPAEHYVVFFRHDDPSHVVEIVRVQHGARDWPTLLGDA